MVGKVVAKGTRNLLIVIALPAQNAAPFPLMPLIGKQHVVVATGNSKPTADQDDIGEFRLAGDFKTWLRAIEVRFRRLCWQSDHGQQRLLK
ncbi:hypothetical protein D3C78_1080160 [compost metagenome]